MESLAVWRYNKPKTYRVLETIPGQLEASFLIFLTIGLIKQCNTGGLVSILLDPRADKTKEHSHQNQRINEHPLSIFNKNSVLKATSTSWDTHYQF